MPLPVLAILLLVGLGTAPAAAQIIEIQRNGSTKLGLYHFRATDSTAVKSQRQEQTGLELFARQGAELTFNGPGQALVQLVKLHIGEPDGFNLPLYFFLSPSGDVLGGKQDANEPTAASLVNPLGGAVSLTINKDHKVVGKTGKYTSLKISYQLSGKLVSGSKLPTPTEHLATVVGYGDLGLLFQTAAWRENSKGDLGVFWLQAKIGGSVGSKDNLVQLFGPGVNSSIAHWSIFGGVDINGYLNLKLGLSQVIGKDAVPVFDKPFIKLAFDVTPGN